MTIYEMHVGTFTAGPNGEPGDFDWRLRSCAPGGARRQYDPGNAAE